MNQVYVLSCLVNYIVNGETHGLTEAEIEAVNHYEELCLPSDFNGDTYFGRCDITGEYGDIIVMETID